MESMGGTCSHCGATRSSDRLFCEACGKAEPGALRSLRFKGFTGDASLSDRVERWNESGDPRYTAPEREEPTHKLDRENADIFRSLR